MGALGIMALEFPVSKSFMRSFSDSSHGSFWFRCAVWFPFALALFSKIAARPETKPDLTFTEGAGLAAAGVVTGLDAAGAMLPNVLATLLTVVDFSGTGGLGDVVIVVVEAITSSCLA